MTHSSRFRSGKLRRPGGRANITLRELFQGSPRGNAAGRRDGSKLRSQVVIPRQERNSVAQAQAFDPIAFKQKMRDEWNNAADGWRRWCHVVEGEDGGQRHSAKLVELARIRSGAS